MLQNQEFSKLEAVLCRAFEGRLKLTFSGTKTQFVARPTAGVSGLTSPTPPRKFHMFIDNEPYAHICTHARASTYGPAYVAGARRSTVVTEERLCFLVPERGLRR